MKAIKLLAPLSLIIAMGSQTGFAAGFEKDVLWSGQYVGSAGAAVSTASGAEALFFNPAGIGDGKAGSGNVSVNVSPTIAQYSGPLTTSNVTVDGNSKVLPVFGVLGSYNVTDKLSFAAGAYTSGGTRSDYEGVSLGSAYPTYTPDIKGQVTITEFSLGGAYEVLPGFSFGAAWRVMMVRGELSSLGNPTGNAFVYADFDNLKATEYNGFRLGMQYKDPGKKWGLGATFRNAVDFDASSDLSGEIIPKTGSGAPLNALNATTPGTLSSTFPWQLSVGGNYAFTDSFRLMADYVFSHYKTDQALTATGSLAIPAADGGGSVTSAQLSKPLDWKNMSNVKVGGEYTGISNWAIRAGYIYTSQVTPDDFALPIIASPGAGHTITAGAGTWVMSKALELDGSLEYSFAKGTVDGNATNGVLAGEYKTHAIGFHLGGTYNF